MNFNRNISIFGEVIQPDHTFESLLGPSIYERVPTWTYDKDPNGTYNTTIKDDPDYIPPSEQDHTTRLPKPPPPPEPTAQFTTQQAQEVYSNLKYINLPEGTLYSTYLTPEYGWENRHYIISFGGISLCSAYLSRAEAPYLVAFSDSKIMFISESDFQILFNTRAKIKSAITSTRYFDQANCQYFWSQLKVIFGK